MRGWVRFIQQFQKDLRFWLFCFFSLTAFRLIFIFVFHSRVAESTGPLPVLTTVLNGMRFDCMVATYWMLPPFLFSVICGIIDARKLAERARGITAGVFIVLTAFICTVTFEYFREFNDQFNHFLFNFYYDDTRAILTTVWREYHAATYMGGMLLIIFFGIKFKGRIIRNGFIRDDYFDGRHIPVGYRILSVLLVIAALVVGLRGSAGRRPMQRHDAAITRDEFLNKAVFNPYMALKYALKDYIRLSNSSGLEAFLPGGDVAQAARYVSGKTETLKSLDDYMLKHARGTRNPPARHVFLIVIESYDTWPMLDKYSSLGLTEGLKGIAGKGMFIKNFLPASGGTMESLASLVSGLPEAGVFTNYQKSAKTAFPTSIARTFKELGYRTRFFYGGYLSWQRADEFMKAQGFDEVYGAPDMASWDSTNEWGVPDDCLYGAVLKKVSNEEPSLNLILTTSYHPPYTIDVYGKGFKLRQIPEDVRDVFDSKKMNLRILGHLWNADRALGVFVKEMEEKVSRPLFAITGDHFGRKHISVKPDIFESSAVPLVLYGKETLRGLRLPDGAAGSHIDIIPTLIERVAPRGFAYYALGEDLLMPRERFYGVGLGRVIGKDFITDLKNFYPVPGEELPGRLPDIKELRKLHGSMHAISWWRIKRGPEINGGR